MDAMERVRSRAIRHGPRWAGALAGAGAVAAALLMVLTPSAAGVTAGSVFPTGSQVLYIGDVLQGCAKLSAKSPTFSLKTGDGGYGASATSKACAASKGGSAVASTSESYDELGAVAVYPTYRGATSVTVNYTLAANVGSSASGKISNPSACPWYNYTTTGVYSAPNGSSAPYAYTYHQQECYVLSEYYVDFQPYVLDVTTGTYAYTTSGGYYDFNASGQSYISYYEAYNFTTPGWSNLIYTGTSLAHYGTSNSSRLSTTGSAVISGSWGSAQRLELFAFYYVYAYSEVYGVTKGTATATITATPAKDYLDITKVTVR